MAKKATRRDFYMEIRKSPGRFFSILFIIALGVAFFSGIRASEPDMRITGDSYFDAAELMDIKALSTYGVTKEDVEAFGELPGVEKAEGEYSADFIYNLNEEQHVVHGMGIQKEMNPLNEISQQVLERKISSLVPKCRLMEVILVLAWNFLLSLKFPVIGWATTLRPT